MVAVTYRLPGTVFRTQVLPLDVSLTVPEGGGLWRRTDGGIFVGTTFFYPLKQTPYQTAVVELLESGFTTGDPESTGDSTFRPRTREHLL